MCKNICLSFGENCLTDDILSRFGLKSFSSPYSFGRSNIEYILQIEKDRFTNFLNPDFLQYEYFGDKQVVRLKTYNKVTNFYENSCINGFEFTHHDVISNVDAYHSMERKYQRLLELKDVNLFIFYHHRFCNKTDMHALICHLKELRNIYLKRCSKVEVLIFTQVIINDPNARKVCYNCIDDIHLYELYTLHMWSGNDDKVFWAHCDDDLLLNMIGHFCLKNSLCVNLDQIRERQAIVNCRLKL